MNAPATRTETGQFIKGVSGNPAGRPVGRRGEIVELRQDLEIALRQHVQPKVVKEIINKMINKARNGNIAAAKLILDKVLPNASDSEDGEQPNRSIRVFVENVTVAAPRESQSPSTSSEPIEGQFTEVSK